MYFVFCISITFFSVICIWNTIWAKQRISLTFLLWMDAPYASISSTTGCTIQNLWVKELRYLSVHILQSCTFKCSLSNHRKTVYRSANAIFGKIGLIVSEDVILQLRAHVYLVYYMVLMHALWLKTYRLPDWLIESSCAWILNKLCGRPPQYAPAPASWPLTFWPWK